MSSVGLFIVGFFVTLLVFGAAGLMVWGAIMDGRYDSEMRNQREQENARPQRATGGDLALGAE